MSIESSVLIDVEEMLIRANNKVDTYSGEGAAVAFVVENGNVGDDFINDFGATDSLITGKAIFDGNGDSLIGFGKNGLLDIDRTSARKAGNDQLTITDNGKSVKELRHMGEFEGQHAYAVASTWHNFKTIEHNGSEGSIGNDEMWLNDSPLLIDNALGLRTGSDVIHDTLPGAKFVTTAKLKGGDIGNIVEGTYIDGNLHFDVHSANGVWLGDVTVVGAFSKGLLLVDTTEVGDQTFYTYQTMTMQM